MLGRSGLFDFHDGGVKSCCDRRALSPDVPTGTNSSNTFFLYKMSESFFDKKLHDKPGDRRDAIPKCSSDS